MVWTEEALMNLPDDGLKYELIGGELETSEVGMERGEMATILASELGAFARAQRLGVAVSANTAFWMKSGDSLSPDVSFVSKDRLRGRRPSKKFFQGAPDLAVEIVSPHDVWQKLNQKMAELFANGTRLAWVINPGDQTVLVYHSAQPDRILKAGDLLDGEDVVPGFSMPVADLFAEWDFETAASEADEVEEFDEADDDE